jgi:hypothetical protein
MRLLAQHLRACLGLDFEWIDLVLDGRQTFGSMRV